MTTCNVTHVVLHTPQAGRRDARGVGAIAYERTLTQRRKSVSFLHLLLARLTSKSGVMSKFSTPRPEHDGKHRTSLIILLFLFFRN